MSDKILDNNYKILMFFNTLLRNILVTISLSLVLLNFSHSVKKDLALIFRFLSLIIIMLSCYLSYKLYIVVNQYKSIEFINHLIYINYGIFFVLLTIILFILYKFFIN